MSSLIDFLISLFGGKKTVQPQPVRPQPVQPSNLPQPAAIVTRKVLMVVYDPEVISYDRLLKTFFEEHDPTQGMRQGNDIGTTYRSAIYTTTQDQMDAATARRDSYQAALVAAGHNGRVTTEIAPAGEFYYAEPYHQQYLAKNPGGYCGLRGTGVACAGE